MAAGAWKVFDSAKDYLGRAGFNFSSGIFRVTLHTSALTISTGAFSVYSPITSEVTEANGYSSSGKTLSATTWNAGASAGVQRFDATAVFWSANGGNIANIKFAVIWLSAAATANRLALCYSTLSTSQFTISSGNRLTITPAANGVFELSGGQT